MQKRSDLKSLLLRAYSARQPLLDDAHHCAIRLFNGHLEGCSALVADLYADTLLLYNCEEPPAEGAAIIETAQRFFMEREPWIRSIVVKERHGATSSAKQGRVILGEAPTRKICEHGIWYGVDLLINQDASFYLDTRHVRLWAKENLSGTRVLNTFAYTSSLGVAAEAGGARQVIHTDLNRRFLNVAKTSYTLNGFPINKANFQTADIWPYVNRLKRAGEQFDCVILDPPHFSQTRYGTVNLLEKSHRLINKVRPLIRRGGLLLAINNALYLSGQAYLAVLNRLCADGYMSIEDLIDVPPDCAGYAHTRIVQPISDPAPFNHSTKIALLRML